MMEKLQKDTKLSKRYKTKLNDTKISEGYKNIWRLVKCLRDTEVTNGCKTI